MSLKVEVPLKASRVIGELADSLKLPTSGQGILERQDFASSELWRVDLDWGGETQVLRQIAVTTPEKFTPSLVRETLKSLHLVDKQITELDHGLLQYSNLEELTLTGNYLKEVNPENIPPQLKVLELCYNQLRRLEELDKRPPKHLQHLGVGFNSISHLSLAPSHWTHLLSLDLSHNLLADLPASVRTLSQLPKLRSLQLIGNPLALVPCYWSYTVDCLQSLTCLDDSDITVKDQQQVTGISKYCSKNARLVKSAHFELEVADISGLPELQDNVTDTEEEVTRYVLQVVHAFLPEDSCRKLANLRDEEEAGGIKESQFFTIVNKARFSGTLEESEPGSKTGDLNLLAIHGASRSFKPIVYTVPPELSSLGSVYEVDDLCGLKAFLERGIDWKILLWKLKFAKDKEQNCGESMGGQRLTSAKGKSTAQPSTTSKQNVAKKPPATKGKGKPQAACAGAELPGEGWHPTSTKSFLLASYKVDTSPLLENKPTLQEEISTPLFATALQEHGLLPIQEESSSAGNEPQVKVAFKLSVKHWNCVSDVLA